MGASGSADSEGKSVSATAGVAYGREVIESTSSAERIFDLGLETRSVLIQANPGNSDNIFLGWDGDVDSNSGIILEPGDTITIDIDLNVQNVWAIAASSNDDLRFLAMR